MLLNYIFEVMGEMLQWSLYVNKKLNPLVCSYTYAFKHWISCLVLKFYYSEILINFIISYVFIYSLIFTLEIKGLLFLASKVYYGFSFFNIFPIQSVFLYVC